MSGEQPIGAGVRPHISWENSGGCVSVDILLMCNSNENAFKRHTVYGAALV